jgi:hypothetical protein
MYLAGCCRCSRTDGRRVPLRGPPPRQATPGPARSAHAQCLCGPSDMHCLLLYLENTALYMCLLADLGHCMTTWIKLAAVLSDGLSATSARGAAGDMSLPSHPGVSDADAGQVVEPSATAAAVPAACSAPLTPAAVAAPITPSVFGSTRGKAAGGVNPRGRTAARGGAATATTGGCRQAAAAAAAGAGARSAAVASHRFHCGLARRGDAVGSAVGQPATKGHTAAKPAKGWLRIEEAAAATAAASATALPGAAAAAAAAAAGTCQCAAGSFTARRASHRRWQ